MPGVRARFGVLDAGGKVRRRESSLLGPLRTMFLFLLPGKGSMRDGISYVVTIIPTLFVPRKSNGMLWKKIH